MLISQFKQSVTTLKSRCYNWRWRKQFDYEWEGNSILEFKSTYALYLQLWAGIFPRTSFPIPSALWVYTVLIILWQEARSYGRGYLRWNWVGRTTDDINALWCQVCICKIKNYVNTHIASFETQATIDKVNLKSSPREEVGPAKMEDRNILG